MEKVIKKNEFVNELKYFDEYDHFEAVINNTYFFNKANKSYIFNIYDYDIKIKVLDIDSLINVYYMFIDKLNEQIELSFVYYQYPF